MILLPSRFIPLLKKKLNDLKPQQKLRYFEVLGNYYYAGENPDSAIHYYRMGLAAARETDNAYYIASFHLWLGINYNIKSEYEPALSELTLAEETAALTDSIKLQNTVVRNKGNVYWGMGVYEKALENYFRSLKISEDNHFNSDIASSLNNIGNVYQSISDYPRAREYYSRSLSLAEKNNFNLVAAITSNNIGDLLLLQKKYDSALVYFNRSLRLSTSLGSKFYQGIALFNIGDTYLQNDSAEVARAFINRSLTKATEAGDRLGIAECYLKLGEIFLNGSSPRKAETFLDSGMLMAEQIGSLRLLDQAHELKTQFYNELSDFPSAYKTLEKRLALKDSIFKQESGKNIAKLEARNREEQRKRQIDELKREKINNRNIFLVGTVRPADHPGTDLHRVEEQPEEERHPFGKKSGDRETTSASHPEK